MKTSLTCLGLLVVAVLLGKHQQKRIAALEQLLAAAHPSEPLMAARGDRDDQEPDYRTKYQKHSRPPSVSEVYQTVVGSLKTGKGVLGGPVAVMENREAFRAIMQLDLADQQELIRLIARSDDPKFQGDSLYKCEQINVCLCAMADRHPEMALDDLRHSDEKIGRFYRGRMTMDPMVGYVILRLCDRNPQAGLDALVEQANKKSESWGADSTANLLCDVARRQPDRVIETIGKLPADQRQESLRMVLSQVETTEESTRMFQALRNPLASDQAALRTALTSLCENFATRDRSWEHILGWLQTLNLSDKEKLCAAHAVNNWMSDASIHGQELAAKVLDFMPPSKERDYLVWRAVTFFGNPNDSAAGSEYLKQLNIDHEEMLRLARDEYLRP